VEHVASTEIRVAELRGGSRIEPSCLSCTPQAEEGMKETFVSGHTNGGDPVNAYVQKPKEAGTATAIIKAQPTHHTLSTKSGDKES
jgi:hypothetical protein